MLKTKGNAVSKIAEGDFLAAEGPKQTAKPFEYRDYQGRRPEKMAKLLGKITEGRKNGKLLKNRRGRF